MFDVADRSNYIISMWKTVIGFDIVENNWNNKFIDLQSKTYKKITTTDNLNKN